MLPLKFHESIAVLRSRVIAEFISLPEWRDVVRPSLMTPAARITVIGRPQLTALAVPCVKSHADAATPTRPQLPRSTQHDPQHHGPRRGPLHPRQFSGAPIAASEGPQGRGGKVAEAGVGRRLIRGAPRSAFGIGKAADGVVRSPLWSYQLGLEGVWMPADPRAAAGTEGSACGEAPSPLPVLAAMRRTRTPPPRAPSLGAYRCAATDHLSAACTEPRACYRCGSADYLSAAYSQPRTATSS
ncbi:hypothetical protein DFH09DRAFT_1315470 [Mycena vulgaris]|nr:hypothetical protein DFH09DRAFT_1315470 [Mycena vulgaris]